MAGGVRRRRRRTLLAAAAAAAALGSDNLCSAHKSAHATATVASPASFVGDGDANATKPNILMFYVDDLGYGDIGYNNRELLKASRHLNKLAAAGITQFIAKPIGKEALVQALFSDKASVSALVSEAA